MTYISNPVYGENDGVIIDKSYKDRWVCYMEEPLELVSKDTYWSHIRESIN